jgi:hypothetical protein
LAGALLFAEKIHQSAALFLFGLRNDAELKSNSLKPIAVYVLFKSYPMLTLMQIQSGWTVPLSIYVSSMPVPVFFESIFCGFSEYLDVYVLAVLWHTASNVAIVILHVSACDKNVHQL